MELKKTNSGTHQQQQYREDNDQNYLLSFHICVFGQYQKIKNYFSRLIYSVILIQLYLYVPD